VRKKFRSFETTIIEVYHGKNILISWAKYKKVGQISFCPANFSLLYAYVNEYVAEASQANKKKYLGFLFLIAKT
jgi:hypothetical protein